MAMTSYAEGEKREDVERIGLNANMMRRSYDLGTFNPNRYRIPPDVSRKEYFNGQLVRILDSDGAPASLVRTISDRLIDLDNRDPRTPYATIIDTHRPTLRGRRPLARAASWLLGHRDDNVNVYVDKGDSHGEDGSYLSNLEPAQPRAPPLHMQH